MNKKREHPNLHSKFIIFFICFLQIYRDPLINIRLKPAPKLDSGISSLASSIKSEASGISSKKSNNSMNNTSKNSSKNEDDVLDQLARQTASALNGGRTLSDEETSSSEDNSPNIPLANLLSYEILSLSF